MAIGALASPHEDVVTNTRWSAFAHRAVEHVTQARAGRYDDSSATIPFTKKFRGASDAATPLDRGNAIVDGVRETFRQIDAQYMRRYSYQMEICEMFLSACAPTIYMDAFEDYAVQIMLRNHWRARDMNSFCLVQTMRQAGKSTITAIFIAALLLNRPHLFVIIVATVFKQARLIFDEVIAVVRKIRPDVRITVCNSEVLELDFGNGDKRRVEALKNNPMVSHFSLRHKNTHV